MHNGGRVERTIILSHDMEKHFGMHWLQVRLLTQHGFLSKQGYSSYLNTVNTRAVLRTSVLYLTTFSLFSKHLLMAMWLSVKAKWAKMSSMLKSLEELT